jgi:hypothetical protein
MPTIQPPGRKEIRERIALVAAIIGARTSGDAAAVRDLCSKLAALNETILTEDAAHRGKTRRLALCQIAAPRTWTAPHAKQPRARAAESSGVA